MKKTQARWDAYKRKILNQYAEQHNKPPKPKINLHEKCFPYRESLLVAIDQWFDLGGPERPELGIEMGKPSAQRIWYEFPVDPQGKLRVPVRGDFDASSFEMSTNADKKIVTIWKGILHTGRNEPKTSDGTVLSIDGYIFRSWIPHYIGRTEFIYPFSPTKKEISKLIKRIKEGAFKFNPLRKKAWHKIGTKHLYRHGINSGYDYNTNINNLTIKPIKVHLI